MDGQYGSNLLDPGSLKTTEIVCCLSSSRNSTEIGPNSVVTCTRSLDLRNLSAESRWFQGPAFLHEGETSWPLERRLLLNDCSEEGKQELAKINLTFQFKKTLYLFDIDRFSS